MDLFKTALFSTEFRNDALNELRYRLKQVENSEKILDNDYREMLEEDWWPFCFLAQNDYDVDITYPIVIQCLKWRKSFCVQRIRILELKPLLEKSAIYMYGRDLNSFPILWFKMNRIKVDEANAEELFIYWLERYRTSAKREYPVTLLFDMSGTGLQNLSLEFVRFILHAFKYYYPCCLGLLLVYENPTILSASWRLVKSWMDTMMQPPLKHVTQESIGNYISSYYVPIEMGGKDLFEFTMDSLGRYVPTQLDGTETGGNNKNIPSPDLDGFNKQRNVRFDGDNPVVLSSEDGTLNNRTNGTENFGTASDGVDQHDGASTATDSTSARKSSIIKRNSIPLPVTLEFLADARRNSPASDIFTDKFLSICPKDTITLNVVAGEVDPVDVIALKNAGTEDVVYKIKITSPEKFRVHPSAGIISAGETEFVRVNLKNEHKHTIAGERFLIMATKVQSFKNTDFATVWKNASAISKVKHKLKCCLNRGSTSASQNLYQSNIPNSHALPSSFDQNSSFSQQLEKIATRQKMIAIGLLILIILQIATILHSVQTQSYIKSLKQTYPSADMSTINVEPIDVDSEL